MEPYRIISATLISYSGKRVKMEVKSDVLTCPLRKAKDRLLDYFTQKCRNNNDPFVKIEVSTQSLFKS